MCGNIGLLLVLKSLSSSPEAAIRKYKDILKEQMERTRVRGSQAGGLSIINQSIDRDIKPSIQRVRVVPLKRHDLAETLLRAFHNKVPKEIRNKIGRPGSYTSCLGHSRFATSSP